MRVIKRNGEYENVSFDKVLNRLKYLSDDIEIDICEIAQKVCGRIYDGVSTSDLDELAAHLCSSLVVVHPDYGRLASKIIISNHHKNTSPSFSETIHTLFHNPDGPLISQELYDIVQQHKTKLNSYIDYNRDYDFDYFGFKTLERSYLLKSKGKILERPQQMWMRVSLGIHKKDIKDALQTYDMLSKKYFTHATPTLFNSGTPRPQNSSCFLLSMREDSIIGIYNSLKDVAMISKYAGGIGIHIHQIRAKGSIIRGTHGISSGLVSMLRVFNTTARYVDQAGKRLGSIACFCENTEVFTINEGVKHIQNVKIGDLVITHKNRIKPVTQVHKNPLGHRKIYKLQVEKTKTIYVTGNHRFWSFYTNKYKSNKSSLGWNSIEDLKCLMDNKQTTRQACYVSLPTGTNIENTNNYKINVMDYKDCIVNDTFKEIVVNGDQVMTISKKDHKVAISEPINRIWNITEDLANLFGIWLGDGFIRKERTGGKIRGITFTVDNRNLGEINYIKKVCYEVFGWNVISHSPKGRNVTNIEVNSTMIGLIFNELFGNCKKLPNMIFSWPKKLVNSLIAGLITTDGHITKKYNATLCLSNAKLMNQIHHLCRHNGIDVSFLKCNIAKGQTCCSYSMSIPLSMDILNRVYKYYKDDRIDKYNEQIVKNSDKEYDQYLKILSITETDRTDEYVYTLGVEEDHSYTVEGLLVENCYLEPWHADVEQFLELRKNHGNEEERCRDLFLALWVSDLFMERVKNNQTWSLMCPDQCPGLSDVWGDKFNQLYTSYEEQKLYVRQINAQDLWFKILESQIETGVPYICYKDACNRKSNQQNLGTIKSSNLCVAPETLILTEDGYFPICSLHGKKVRVWNGCEFTETQVHQTGRNKKLIRIGFSNGMEIRCTPYHKFHLQDNTIVDAQDLILGSYLLFFQTPTLNTGKLTMQSPYTHGFFCSSREKHSRTIFLSAEKTRLLQFLDYSYVTPADNDGYVMVEVRPELEDRYFVPLNHCLNDKLRWLEGYLDGFNSLQTSSRNKDFLTNIFYMLQTLGVESDIYPYIRGTYILNIHSDCIPRLQSLGFSPQWFILNHQSLTYNINNKTVKIIRIQDLDEYDDTYCFNEPNRHMGIFNGVIAGNCTEIMEYSEPNEIAVCNLASLALPSYIDQQTLQFDFDLLHNATKIVTKNLNKIIDGNFYPLEEARRSNLKHRPIGIGIQGLADVFILMRIPFESNQAQELNKMIFETIYHAALETSMEIARKRHVDPQEINEYDPLPTSKYPGAYYSFEGSPASNGILQFDMWGVVPSQRYDWASLKNEIQQYGIRNSLLLAPMPTASTAQILGFNESFEPITSNIFKRKTLSGEFIIVNKYLIRDLIRLGIWNTEMKDRILLHDGSIQYIDEIPQPLKDLYKTVWEIKQKTLIDMSADRGAFICQSQSLNIFMEDPDYKKLSSMHFYGWSKGLKTGSYYIRTKPKAKTQQFTIDPNFAKNQLPKKSSPTPNVVCTDEICTMCSS